MQLTLTNEQRLGIVSMFMKQQPKRLKDQLTNYEVVRKVELDELTRSACFIYGPNNRVDLDMEIVSQTSTLDFEKAEIRAIEDLLKNGEFTVNDVRWAHPLLKLCETALA